MYFFIWFVLFLILCLLFQYRASLTKPGNVADNQDLNLDRAVPDDQPSEPDGIAYDWVGK